MSWPEWKKNLAVMWLVQFIGMGSITGVVAFLPLYLPQLGVTSLEQVELWSGILMGTAPLCAGIASPYWGAIADRKGRKPMVERVMVMFGSVMIAMAFVANVYQLLALRIVQGIFGGFTAAALALVTATTPQEEIGFTLGIFQTAMIAGGAVGPMLGGLIADHFGFRETFAVFGALCLLSFTIIHFAVRERFTPVLNTAKPSVLRDVRGIINIPGLKSMLVVQFLLQFSIQIITPVMPLYIQSMAPDSPYIATLCGMVIAIAGITSAFASAGISYIANRFGNRTILTAAAAAGSLIFAWQAMAADIITLTVLRGVSGLCLGAMMPTSNTIITQLIPAERRGMAYGVTTGAAQLGNVMGPLTGGALALSLGLSSVFWVTALLFVIISVWVGWRVKAPGAG